MRNSRILFALSCAWLATSWGGEKFAIGVSVVFLVGAMICDSIEILKPKVDDKQL